MEQITVNRECILDMAKLIEELRNKLESLELASDPEFMDSLNKSKEQIKKRDFGNWNEL